MKDNSYIEVDYCQWPKHGQHVAGDVFLSRKLDQGERIVSVLADGLGSGVEATVLASLTATMALEYAVWNIDTAKAAEILMDSLPIDTVRKISYSAFSIVDTNANGRTRVIEHGNPCFVLVRNGQFVPIEPITVSQPRWHRRTLTYTEFDTQIGDRIVLMSDGVTQSGIGTEKLPLGWGADAARDYVLDVIHKAPGLSASGLSEHVIERAAKNDGKRIGDDMTCGVIYWRTPRKLIILTGPPYEHERDTEFARFAAEYDGRKVIAGGTTANIIARILGREVTMDLTELDPEIPTPSKMAGVDLVCEGCITFGKVAEMLETGAIPKRRNGATRLMNLLLSSDIIEFKVGTSVNEAHQDPRLPIELDIRRNVVKRIARLLEDKHFKQTSIEFF